MLVVSSFDMQKLLRAERAEFGRVVLVVVTCLRRVKACNSSHRFSQVNVYF